LKVSLGSDSRRPQLARCIQRT